MLHRHPAAVANGTLLFLALALAGCGRTEGYAPVVVGCEDCTTLVGANVFDGVTAGPGAVVLRGNRIEQFVRGEVIVEAGEVVALPGRTVLPGLFEAHAHVTSPSGPGSGLSGDDLVAANFRAMLRSGVTSVVDLGGSAHVLFEYRRRIRRGDLTAPMLLSAGSMITPSGGHPCYSGTLPGDTCLLADEPQDATGAVEMLAAEGADVVKVVIESGRPEFQLPEIGEDVLGAVVARASDAGLLVVAHVSHADDIDKALDAGVRVFAHVPTYDEITREQAERMAAAQAVVIPTLTVRDGFYRLCSRTMSELDDPRLADDVPAGEIAALKDPARLGKVGQPENAPRYLAELDHMRVNLRRCLQAGVSVVAGTDAGNLGTFHGLSLRRELALYVQEGMTPLEALRAATRNAAELFGQRDRGRIEGGAVADLLVVRGNPADAIEALTDVEMVFLAGKRLDREGLALPRATTLVAEPARELELGHACLRGGECVDGARCDADFRCSATCEGDSDCAWGEVCRGSQFPESGATCLTGDGCAPLAQDCPNATACVWLGRGATRCWYAGTGQSGAPCSSWGGCAVGHQCDSSGICRALCDPVELSTSCPAGQACVDDTAQAGVAVGHCAAE